MTTIQFYERNAESFTRDTGDVDMSATHDRFLAQLPPSAIILDAGCGSGRDAAAFLERGHRVHAFDASSRMARLAEARIGQHVEVLRFDEFESHDKYDGVWACASLLHVPEDALPDAISRLWQALRPSGVLYVSFKQGKGERSKDGRHFTDATEARLAHWTLRLKALSRIECWQSVDARPSHRQEWLNALLVREAEK